MVWTIGHRRNTFFFNKDRLHFIPLCALGFCTCIRFCYCISTTAKPKVATILEALIWFMMVQVRNNTSLLDISNALVLVTILHYYRKYLAITAAGAAMAAVGLALFVKTRHEEHRK